MIGRWNKGADTQKNRSNPQKILFFHHLSFFTDTNSSSEMNALPPFRHLTCGKRGPILGILSWNITMWWSKEVIADLSLCAFSFHQPCITWNIRLGTSSLLWWLPMIPLIIKISMAFLFLTILNWSLVLSISQSSAPVLQPVALITMQYLLLHTPLASRPLQIPVMLHTILSFPHFIRYTASNSW